MKKLFSLMNVRKEHRLGSKTIHALRGVDLTIYQGRYYSVVGPSGSGKSSLLYVLGFVDLPTSGKLVFKGQLLENLSERIRTTLRATDIGFIFQNFQLNPILNALENVAIALRVLGVSKKNALKNARESLLQVGLGDRLKHYPNELSGGQRQRVAIARAVVKRPTLILADEPTGNLDSITGDEIIQMLRYIVNEQGTTVVQVTHDREAARVCDEVITLRDGIIIESAA